MAIPHPLKAFVPAFGSEGATEAQLKVLRAAGRVPTAKRGGWGGEWEQAHYLNVALAAVGMQPGDAPAIIDLAERSTYPRKDRPARLGGGTLYDVMLRTVGSFAKGIDDRLVEPGLDVHDPANEALLWPSLADYDPERSAPDRFIFTFYPFEVDVEWHGRGSHADHRETYSLRSDDKAAQAAIPQQWKTDVSRTATMPARLLKTAAMALLEASPRRARVYIPSKEGSDHAD